MEVTIDEEHEDAIKLFLELIQNYGIVDAQMYYNVEQKHPQYFDTEVGFIDYHIFLNEILWMPNVIGYCAYILMLSNGKTYKGFTGNFIRRMVDHFSGIGCKTTKRCLPIYILHYHICKTKHEATQLEQYFKKFSGLDKITKRFSPLNTVYPK